VGAHRARAQRQRRGGRAPSGCWAHRGAGIWPARRARLGDRPCIHLVWRSWAHSDPWTAAALWPCGRDVAEDIGSGQTWRSAHKRQGRAADCGGNIGLRCSYLDACEAGWRAVAATSGGAGVRRQDWGRHSCLAACCVERCRSAPALLAGRAGNPVRSMCGGRWRRSRRRVGRSACANGPVATRRDCSSLRALASLSGCGCMVSSSGLPAAWLSHAASVDGRVGLAWLSHTVTCGSCMCELLVSFKSMSK